jgi:hypothetical protein
MELYGRKWTRRELEARVGRLEQIAGLRRFRLEEGLESGTEQIQVRTGSGLSYYVTPSRGLDISLAEFAGIPLSWSSPSGDVHPSYYNPEGAEWLRTAAGGLLMTCGLTYVGAPGEDEGISFGLHGRIHHLPARHISTHAEWADDEYSMVISGIVEESAIFGENIRLSRIIRSKLGTNAIEIEDNVENLGFDPAPHMILYHFNFGFPLLNKETTIDFPSGSVVARESQTPIDGYKQWQEPQAGYRERVYYHQDLPQDRIEVTINNPSFPAGDRGGTVPLSVRLSWLSSQLPRLVQWKMPGEGIHVLGIEPANCYVEGRAAERSRGSLVILNPGQSRTYQLKLEVGLGK